MLISDEERILCRHITDLINQAERQYVNKFTSFLTLREQDVLRREIGGSLTFYGGFEGSERKVLGVLVDKYSDNLNKMFPIKLISLSYKAFNEKDKLTHRDLLGAFMSCGIKRETIGDILISDTFSVVACTGVSAEIICDEVSKIGRLGVRIEKDYSGELPQSKFIMLDEIVPSLRLDCIIGAVTKLSREKSALLLKSGSVVHNGTEEKNVSKNISLGDIFTIKGYGKFSLSEIGGKTKSDRIHIKIKKFL